MPWFMHKEIPPKKSIADLPTWKPGDLFKELTGRSVDDCPTIDDIDAEVARALKIKGPLPFDNNPKNYPR